jgi:hypothetical protein
VIYFYSCFPCTIYVSGIFLVKFLFQSFYLISKFLFVVVAYIFYSMCDSTKYGDTERKTAQNEESQLSLKD